MYIYIYIYIYTHIHAYVHWPTESDVYRAEKAWQSKGTADVRRREGGACKQACQSFVDLVVVVMCLFVCLFMFVVCCSLFVV